MPTRYAPDDRYIPIIRRAVLFVKSKIKLTGLDGDFKVKK